MTEFDWTPEAIAVLTRLWSEGRPIRVIGETIGCGKSAAVSKVHRLGLPPRPSPIVGADLSRPKPPRATKPKPEKVAKPVSIPGVPPAIAAMPLGHGVCRFPMWPHGAEPDHHFCGAPAIVGRPYCHGHAARCWTYQKPSEAA